MKKRILVIILCLACVTAFGQKKKKKPAKKPATTTQTQAANTPVAKPTVDTTRKVAAAPAKPFDRPLDGYYKKTNILNAKVTPYPTIRESDAAYSANGCGAKLIHGTK